MRKVEIMIGVDPASFIPDNMPTMENARLLDEIKAAADRVVNDIEALEKWPVLITTALSRFGAGSMSQITNDADYDKDGVKALESEVISLFRSSLRAMMTPVLELAKGNK